MRIIGCDLHTRQQTIAMFDTESKEVMETTLFHEGEALRNFYGALPRPALVGIEATGAMFWFLQLMEELCIPCLVGHPAAIRRAETRKQKHDRRDAALLLRLLMENRFPAIWMPSAEQRDLRHLLLHRHQLVSMRSRVQHALPSLAFSHGLRLGARLWSRSGEQALASLPLTAHAAQRRNTLQKRQQHLATKITALDEPNSLEISPLSTAFAPNRSPTSLSTAFTQRHRGVGYQCEVRLLNSLCALRVSCPDRIRVANPFFSYYCELLNALAVLFATPIFCFQQLARSFAKTPGGGGYRRSDLQTFRPSDAVSFALCFHNLTNPSSHNPFRFTSIQNPRGCHLQRTLRSFSSLRSFCLSGKFSA